MTAPIRSMPELVAALRARRDELQLTHETIDAVAGLQNGYASKLLAPNPIKNLGWMSLGSVLGALGIAIVVVEDPEQVSRISRQWTKRERPQRHLPQLPSPSTSLSIQNQVPMELQVTPELRRLLHKPEYMRAIGLRGNLKRNKKLSRWKRSVLARRAAKARWARQQEMA